MPVAKVENDATPPEKPVTSNIYGDIYTGLYKAKVDTWTAIRITHTKENRLREIANVRRACQRFFSLADVKPFFRMESRVERIDEYNSVMYVFKGNILPVP